MPTLWDVVFGCAVEILHIRQTDVAAFETGTKEGHLRISRAVGKGQRRGIRPAIGREISDIQSIARIRYRNEIAEVVVIERNLERSVHRDVDAARDIVALHRQRLRGGRGTRRHVQELKRRGQSGDKRLRRKSRHRDVIQTKKHLVGTVEVSESNIDRLTGVGAQIDRPQRPCVSCLRGGLLKQQCERRGIGRRCGRDVHSVMLGIGKVAYHTVERQSAVPGQRDSRRNQPVVWKQRIAGGVVNRERHERVLAGVPAEDTRKGAVLPGMPIIVGIENRPAGRNRAVLKTFGENRDLRPAHKGQRRQQKCSK